MFVADSFGPCSTLATVGSGKSSKLSGKSLKQLRLQVQKVKSSRTLDSDQTSRLKFLDVMR
jgi:hypothetical protein